MPRPIRGTRHGDFQAFTKGMQITKRETRELSPDVEPHETTIIKNDAERAIVMGFLLAKQRDAQAGGTAHREAFQRDRQAVRVLRKVMARIPILPDTAVNA